MSRIEKVGKLNLYLIYPNDYKEPSEIPFQTKLHKIVKDKSPLEYPSIIEKEAEYPFLYNLSAIRGNVVRWLPINKDDRVLELGAECGAITQSLVEMSDLVTAAESSVVNARILAERFSDKQTLAVFAGATPDVLSVINGNKAKFDWIITRDPLSVYILKPLLSEKGRIIFICDNRFGMKYLAGNKNPDCNCFFEGMEGKRYAGFTFAGLVKLLKNAGYEKVNMYYPYPDWRFMKSLFSDKRLPKTGELVDNIRNLDSDRLELFSEKEAFASTVEDGSFSLYSNAYLAVIGEPLEIEYARFSNDRDPKYSIYTTIENSNNIRSIKKRPLSASAYDHVSSMYENYKKLNQRYKGTELEVNTCSIEKEGEAPVAVFDYVKGPTLSEMFDRYLATGHVKEFNELFNKYVVLIGAGEDSEFSDFDAVFSNIIVGQDRWTLIDYEWCKPIAIPFKETAYRSLYCYMLENKNVKGIDVDSILKRLELARESAGEIELDEASFQKKVTGKNLSLEELVGHLGNKSVNPIPLAKNYLENQSIYKLRVYPSNPLGEFSEEKAYDYPNAFNPDNSAEILVNVTASTPIIRIDPLDKSCLVRVLEAFVGEQNFPVENKKLLTCNGKRLNKDSFIFNTNDPNLIFNLSGFDLKSGSYLSLKLEITPLSQETASAVVKSVKILF